MRGRKPTYKTIQRTVDEQPIAPVAIPEPPSTLGGEAATEWQRITRLLKRLRLIAKLDRAALAIYCVAWQDWTEARARIAEQGAIVKSPNGYPIVNPYHAIASQAAKQMQSLLAEFGLSPAARARMIGSPKQEKKPETTGWEGTLANVVG